MRGKRGFSALNAEVWDGIVRINENVLPDIRQGVFVTVPSVVR